MDPLGKSPLRPLIGRKFPNYLQTKFEGELLLACSNNI